MVSSSGATAIIRRGAPYTIPTNPCMPLSDAINLEAKNFSGPWLAGKTRDPV